MLKQLSLVLAISLVLPGCALNRDVIEDPVQVPPVANDDHPCPEGGERPPDIKVVNINYMATPIQVSPERVCARPGDVIWFKLNGKPNSDVVVEAKETGAPWLKGGGRQSWFYAVVPFDIDAPEAIPFYYKVTYKNKVLDPEVRVKNSYY